MKFEAPIVEIKKFELVDVLTVSGESDDPVVTTTEEYIPPFIDDCA